jgi:hypothetical protein
MAASIFGKGLDIDMFFPQLMLISRLMKRVI